MNSERSLINIRVSPTAYLFKSTLLIVSSQVCGGQQLYGGLFKSSESYHDSGSEESLIVRERERERERDVWTIHHSNTIHSLLSSAIVFFIDHDHDCFSSSLRPEQLETRFGIKYEICRSTSNL